MSDVTLSSIIGAVEKFKFNPTKIQRTAIEVLKTAMDSSISIVDPTNPFVFCLEVTAANTAAFMQQNEATTRRLYPSSALTQEDLYLHMSDKDYIDRFAVPSYADFTVIISKSELLSRLILDQLTGIKKVTIPRNSVFTIANVNFSIEYPIDIRLMPSGGLQVVWDTDQQSPLHSLSTNIIEHVELFDSEQQEYIRFTFRAYQFDVITVYNDVTAASGLSTEIEINDQFYYVRVYVQDVSGNYTEIQTTHTQQIYDIYKPTAVVQVSDTKVKIAIPIIYVNSSQIKGKIRIDVYQTKGELNLLLGNYSIDDFKANWHNIDSKDNTVYTAAMSVFRQLGVYSTSNVIGGRNKLSFEQLRDRVILNAIGQHNVPITNIQLQTALQDNGYDIVRNVDTITNRNYLATRALPEPVDSRIVTAASSAMINTTISINSAVLAHGVKDNSAYNSITLTPSVIYKNVNGITAPISDVEYNQINNYTLAQMCLHINENNYFYSPFHYVVDYSGKSLSVRPYYMDSPSITYKSFIKENEATGVQVSIDSSYWIEKDDYGYNLFVPVVSSDSFKELNDSDIYVQMAFNYKTNAQRAYLNAVLHSVNEQTSERIYKFVINTNYNVDDEDYLWLSSFTYENNSSIAKCSLEQQFDIYFCVNKSAVNTNSTTTIDEGLGDFLFPQQCIGVTHEKMNVKFGYALSNLWVRATSALNEIVYKKYTTNIAAVYEKDIIEKDPITGSIFKLNADGSIQIGVDSKPVYNVVHRAGDTVLDGNSNVVYKHVIGDTILDDYSQPIPVDGFERNIRRNIDIFMIEAAYYYSNDPVVSTYKKLVTSSLIDWISSDLQKYTSSLLDQTHLYFYPKSTIGDVKAMALNGVEVMVPANQKIQVVLHVPVATYNNQALIDALNRLTIKTIDTELRKDVISISSIEAALMNEYGQDVINVELSGLGGSANYKTLTILDESSTLSLKKQLTLLADNKIAVTEDVNITYINHDINAS